MKRNNELGFEDILGVQYFNLMKGAKDIMSNPIEHDGLCQIRSYNGQNCEIVIANQVKRILGGYLLSIPVSEGWMEAFQFEKEEAPLTATSWRKGNLTIMQDPNNKDRFYMVVVGANIEIKWIHQLQQLYYALEQDEDNPLKIKTTADAPKD